MDIEKEYSRTNAYEKGTTGDKKRCNDCSGEDGDANNACAKELRDNKKQRTDDIEILPQTGNESSSAIVSSDANGDVQESKDKEKKDSNMDDVVTSGTQQEKIEQGEYIKSHTCTEMDDELHDKGHLRHETESCNQYGVDMSSDSSYDAYNVNYGEMMKDRGYLRACNHEYYGAGRSCSYR
ncbi:hypothetical protein SAMD00019534_082150 [Acytostelium subglobosum LB1]|uniref:hypothetical protein n=1 Tax=Acytostelium subglobosum LB1 TaxID=1410327 RepID=UPI0006449AE2|nr:hypothetical protein SAMD00019534_082150 [Acytostelium subglobosum LB1]GAM25040.1 hypothetical protein SAMD00019534_082150 [Acytostelium subglobosum LB1]|eukprot:XP_012752129.1 hypothetical protein SAMD00019534_082150 [Acytostelium subglobosum LB1]